MVHCSLVEDEQFCVEQEFSFFQTEEQTDLSLGNENQYLSASDFSDNNIADICGISLLKKNLSHSKHKYFMIDHLGIYLNQIDLDQSKKLWFTLNQSLNIFVNSPFV